MKPILSFICIFLLLGCENAKKQKTDNTPEQEALIRAKSELSYNIEKLVLISEATKVSYDTLYHVLLDYLVKTSSPHDSNDSTRLQIISSIKYISSKYQLSNTKISTILFNYKYEMLTKEEIEQAAIENYEPEPDPGDEHDY